MKIGSLFSGYGGLDMAVENITGATPAWFVEYDKHPSAVLAHHYPGVPNYGDITTVDWSSVEPVDILTGGYPCQPFSHAGHRKGTNDERHLWPYVKTALRLLRPRLAVFENVSGHLSLGFDTVLADLAEIGFDAEWASVRASDAGALHGRGRLFVVAADPDRIGLLRGTRRTPAGPRREQPTGRSDLVGARQVWESATGRPAPQPAEVARTGNPQLSARFTEWLMGLPDGWVTGTGIPRNAQLKALGNGVVPQQAELALSILLPRLEEAS